MKKIRLLYAAFFGLFYFFNQTSLYAAQVSIPSIEPVSKEWQNHFRLSDFIKMSPKEFQRITGKKINFFERIAFKVTQNKMKRYIKKHNDLSVTDYIKATDTEKKKFSFLWFIIGFLSPWIGFFATASIIGLILFTVAPIAIVYLTKRSKIEKGSFWAGLGITLILLLIGVAIAAASFNW